MSLLMEALRKAEEAKRRMQQDEQAAASRDAREPQDAAAPPQAGASTSFSLEEREDLTPDYIRSNFTTAQNSFADRADTAAAPPAAETETSPAPESTARNLARRQQRAAAASVFQAKQSPTRDRKMLTILVIAMLLIIPIGAGVLWYLGSAGSDSLGINPSLANYDLSSRSLSDTPPAPPAPQTAPPAVAQIEAEEPAAEDEVEEEGPALATEATEATEATDETADTTTPVADTALASDTTTAAAPVPNPTAPAPNAQTDTDIAAAESTSRGVLEISRRRATREVNPDLVAAYESVQAGDFATAGRLYRQLLELLPNNRDALLGLALIHQRQNQPLQARELYARLLQLNPRDALAQTGLLQTMQIADPAEHESALKQLISQYPNVAQLTLALGNLYASQQRWSEAQAAYYNALLTASRGMGPVHPDYAFNLAVSLEQLDKPKAALDYYRQAQTLARETKPGFDLQQLNSRLDYLSTQAQP